MNKRIVSVLMAAALLSGVMSGCGKKAETPQPDTGTENPPSTESTQVVNPITRVTNEEQLNLTGISFTPTGDMENIAYYVIDQAEGNAIAQMDFTMYGVEYYLRAQSTSETENAPDISGLNYTWDKQATVPVSYLTGKAYINKEAGYVAWLDVAPGIVYNLCTKSATTVNMLSEVAGAVFVPLQGEDGSMPDAPITGVLAYDSIVSSVAAGLADNWASTSPEVLDISFAFASADKASMGFAVEDINGDGKKELLLGKTGDTSPIYDIFTLSTYGKSAHLATGSEQDCYYVTKNGFVAREGSNGSGRFYAFYALDKGVLVLQDALVVKADSWTHSKIDLTSGGTSISQEQADAIRSQYAYADINFESFDGI